MQEKYSISIYPGTGTADGRKGDHVMLCPAYTVTAEDIHEMADRFTRVIEDYFADMKA